MKSRKIYCAKWLVGAQRKSDGVKKQVAFGVNREKKRSFFDPLTKSNRHCIIKTQAGDCKTQSVHLDGRTKEKYR